MGLDEMGDAASYRGRVMVGVLNAIVAAGAVEVSDHGTLELERALEGGATRSQCSSPQLT